MMPTYTARMTRHIEEAREFQVEAPNRAAATMLAHDIAWREADADWRRTGAGPIRLESTLTEVEDAEPLGRLADG